MGRQGNRLGPSRLTTALQIVVALHIVATTVVAAMQQATKFEQAASVSCVQAPTSYAPLAVSVRQPGNP